MREIKVYSRGTWSKRRPREVSETIATSSPLPFSLSDDDLGNSSDISSPENTDLDVPIAIRKGVRSCTQHPISNFVSYSRLSASYKSFLSNISSVSIPNHVQDALADPKWKHAMSEEMKALHNTGTWELTTLPKGKKKLWGASGCLQ